MKNVMIIGAGLSGRGMLGELFYQEGYQITFIDTNKSLVHGLRQQGFYDVQKTSLVNKTHEVIRINNFKILDGVDDKDLYMDEIIKSSLICTALKPEDFNEVIASLLEGIKLRWEKGNFNKLYITLGANFVGLYEYFNTKIHDLLNKDESALFDKYISLVMSIVNRKNLIPFDSSENWLPFTIVGDDKAVLKVERNKIVGLSTIPSFFQMEDDLDRAMAIKIWSGNIVQCAMAFVALYFGKKDTQEASNDSICASFAYQSALEAYYGVYSEFGFPINDITSKAKEAIVLFRNTEFADDLTRIAREPIRKIGGNDRFIGPAKLCLKHGKLPYFITKCLAYVFFINIEGENDFNILFESISTLGIRKTIAIFCNLDFDSKEDKVILDLIENAYLDIANCSFE